VHDNMKKRTARIVGATPRKRKAKKNE